ncbi:MAG: FAD-dependent monooxygenase, partial [Candidatus Eremiobacteraeota bacterium]|nr:FAD-dependent monooxygenase [Candidatus Eremiobacteraeota bacterium]
HSTIRQRAGFEIETFGAPMDVLWMRIAKRPGDPPQTLGTLDHGGLIVMLDRDTYWQCAYIIPKGSFERIKTAGLEAFREGVVRVVPSLRGRLGEIDDWSKVSLLEVRVDRLRRWHRPGLLCIGDAAHAMSPIGGVGINLAIQDAVAAANILAEPLRAGSVGDAALAAVQERRLFPTKVTQAFQVYVQDHAVDPVLQGAEVAAPPRFLRLLDRFRRLRTLPARLIGVGVRPEHVRTPDAFAPSAQSLS